LELADEEADKFNGQSSFNQDLNEKPKRYSSMGGNAHRPIVNRVRDKLKFEFQGSAVSKPSKRRTGSHSSSPGQRELNKSEAKKT